MIRILIFNFLNSFSRYSSSNYRRSASRHLIPPNTVPVDKLLFLRHRAKENMKFGTDLFAENKSSFLEGSHFNIPRYFILK